MAKEGFLKPPAAPGRVGGLNWRQTAAPDAWDEVERQVERRDGAYRSESRHSPYPVDRSMLSSRASTRTPNLDFLAPSNAPTGPAAMSRVGSLRQPPKSTCTQLQAVGNKLKGLSIQEFKVGMIITASHYVEMMDPNVPLADYSCVQSSVGTISAKKRHMIIISKLGTALMTLPLTTASGNGLGKINRRFWPCYMAVSHYPNGPPPPCAGSNPVITVGTWELQALLKEDSFINLNRPYVIDCGQEVRLEGMITETSYKDIKQRFEEIIKQSLGKFTYGK